MAKGQGFVLAVVMAVLVTWWAERAIGQGVAVVTDEQGEAGRTELSSAPAGRSRVEGWDRPRSTVGRTEVMSHSAVAEEKSLQPPKASPFEEEEVGPLPKDYGPDAQQGAPLPLPQQGGLADHQDSGRSVDAPCASPQTHPYCLSEPTGDFFGNRRLSLPANFHVGGWVEQGITVNGSRSSDRFNGPVGFNDRDGEYQLNQVYTFLEKRVDTCRTGWDYGGRIDFLYGTDWRFVRASGLEDDWNQRRFYGAALPQAYADFAVNDCTVRIGHYYTPGCFEVVPAPENFFYSHSYIRMYGQPFTLTGVIGSYDITDQLRLSAGFDRGWNNWEDNNENLEVSGGLSWRSWDGATAVVLTVLTGPYDDAGDLNRTMYNLVLSHYFHPRLRYAIEYNYGLDDDGSLLRQNGSRDDAEWYGISHYLTYEVNRCWSIGTRVEWFVDDDGTRVGGMGAPHGWTLGPDLGPNTTANRIGWAGDFAEVTVGVNWRPLRNVVVRPEARWDWYGGQPDAQGQLPFDSGNKSHLFTFATDVIVRF